jgi:peptide/nickel transport system permease protein
MVRFLARRLFFCAALVVSAASVALLLTRLAPGDLTTELGPFATAREVAAARARFALDRPAAVQWGEWMASASRLDFGESFLYQRPVRPLVLRAAGNTAVLALAALVVATVVGIGLGILTGSRHGVLPGVVRTASIAAVSLPPLLTSLALIFIAARTGWLPVGGMSSLDVAGWAQRWRDVAVHLPLPVLALALPLAAAFERIQSAALLEQIHQPFVLAAAARGVPRLRLVLRHAWPVSVKSVSAIYGLAAGALLSGSFVVEFVTAWPGLGRLMYEALRARDIYLVVGCAAVGAALLSAGMLLGDLLLAASDPRVRHTQ